MHYLLILAVTESCGRWGCTWLERVLTILFYTIVRALS